MMNVLAGIHRTRHNRGFTAIEVSAVATIIAILALILIPIVRNRVAEARLVAAQDDMASIEKAQSIAYGFTGKYFGLMGLERDGFINEIGGTWNKPFSSELVNEPHIKANWSGPYLALHRVRTVAELVVERPYLFRSEDVSNVEKGPILVTQDDLLRGKRMPLDPWGAPYLFFGDGTVGDEGGQIAISTETNFGFPIVFSLGPNGAPGNAVGSEADPKLYFRESAVLGTGDDLYRTF